MPPPGESRLSRRAGYVSERLGVLERLTQESCRLLDVLGADLGQLSALTAPIHSRATALTAAQANIGAAKAVVDALLEHLDTSRRVQPVLAAGPAANLTAFLDALGQLEASNDFLSQHSQLAAVRGALEHSQLVFNGALEACDADFQASLAAGSRGSVPPSGWLAGALKVQDAGAPPSELRRELVPAALLPKLRRMVGLMVDAEFSPAQDGYVATRARHMHQVLSDAHLELPAPGQLAVLPPEQLERAMAGWGRTLRSVVVLLLSEQQLVGDVWPSALAGPLFGRLAQPFLAGLAGAGRDMLDARKGPDKLFCLLDMHAQLSASLPLLADMLDPPPPPPQPPPGRRPSTPSQLGRRPSTPTHAAARPGTPSAPHSPAAGGGGLCAGLVAELRSLLLDVAAACGELLAAYEESVAGDGSKTLPLDGTIHPLTAQVLSFVKRLLCYDAAAEVLYGRAALARRASLEAGRGGPDAADAAAEAAAAAVEEGRPGVLTPAQGGLSAGLARLLMRLLDNLETKSRAYRSEPLAALFMMNNVHYVQWSVEGSAPALRLLGVAWLERHKDVVEEWGAAYHEATWMPLVRLLQAEAPRDVGRLKAMLKDTFSQFNAAIDSIYTNQSGWTIPDHMLRAAVKRVIKDDLLDTYQAFMRTHADVAFTSNPAKYIRYSAADIGSIIDDDLFETKAVSMAKLSLTKEKLGAIV